jgi:phosphoesterase RecJ-like protein
MTYAETTQIAELVAAAHTIVIVQADNPDGDSLGSALALEAILTDLNKQTHLYCGVDIPTYLRYLPGWDRVSNEIPKQFDLSIIVDASTMSLFEKLIQNNQKHQLAGKPCIVLDHHASVENIVPFASVMINDGNRASAGELLYIIATELDWPLSYDAKEAIMSSILGDTQGLSNQLASSLTYRIMADLIDAGISRPDLEEKRREYGKMPTAIFAYKGTLISHTHFSDDGSVAWVNVPQSEINEFSPLYNPAPLIQSDMLQTVGVRVAIVFKKYDDGHVTGAIRCNPSSGIGALLATEFGGGGHAFASGFKQLRISNYDEFVQKVVYRAGELLQSLDTEALHETI